MRILILSALFPPDAKGGAELSAFNSAKWLLSKGFEVGVVTCAASKERQNWGIARDSMRVWQLWHSQPYARANHDNQPSWKKTLWHIQDHCDPRNVQALNRILKEFNPDIVHVHLLVGLGHNSLSALKNTNIPIVYFLHDPGLACLRSNMFKNGQICDEPCRECRISSKLKLSFLPAPDHVTLVSPSQAMLDLLANYLPLESYRQYVLPNLDLEVPISRQAAKNSSHIEFLFVGGLYEIKGISFLISVFLGLSKNLANWRLTVVGGGALEASLRSLCANDERINIVGRVEPSAVKQFISRADIFCLPSLWRENHPGVIREALRAGVPVLASDTGGTPEMVRDRENGLVLKAGDLQVWSAAIGSLLTDPAALAKLQNYAAQHSDYYSVEAIGAELLQINQDAIARVRKSGASGNA